MSDVYWHRNQSEYGFAGRPDAPPHAMSAALITGSNGLIGSEAVRHFHRLGWDVVGIDNDMRGRFFGAEASTRWIS